MKSNTYLNKCKKPDNKYTLSELNNKCSHYNWQLFLQFVKFNTSIFVALVRACEININKSVRTSIWLYAQRALPISK